MQFQPVGAQFLPVGKHFLPVGKHWQFNFLPVWQVKNRIENWYCLCILMSCILMQIYRERQTQDMTAASCKKKIKKKSRVLKVDFMNHPACGVTVIHVVK